MGGLLALAFAAGMIAPVNPCGFALLPAWKDALRHGRPAPSGTSQVIAQLERSAG